MSQVENTCSSQCCSSRQQSDVTVDAIGERYSWKIEGMDCPSCAAKVEKAVAGISGIKQVRVAFATERLLVIADQQAEIETEVVTAIESAGFVVAKETQDQPEPVSRLQQYGRLFALAGLVLIAIALKSVSLVSSELLLIAAIILGVLPVAMQSFKLMRSGSPFSIETLMTVAAIGALFLGETLEAAMVLLLFAVGQHLESYAAKRARQGVQKLMALTPDSAMQVFSDGRKETVSASTLRPDDVIEVLPGDRLPIDGELRSRAASFDESALTGESIPVEREPGEKILAGSLLVDRAVQLTVVSEPGESAVDRIIHLIEEAEERKAPVERFIDAFSRWYTPLMMFIALLVAMVPPLLLAESWDEWIYKALALLLIACPCALVISTPAAVTSALATASRHGALIKGGLALELLGNVKTVAFDKTGTLTEGKPKVVSITTLGGSQQEDDILQLASSLEQDSNHPLALAIMTEAQQRELTLSAVTESQVQAGIGISGRVDEQWVTVSSPRHLQAELARLPEAEKRVLELENHGNTVAVVLSNGEVKGLIALRDNLRPDAKDAVKLIKDLGIHCVMLTGDNTRAAAAIAKEIGMDYRAELMPADKLNTVESLRADGYVAMVGDGINDAPALKAAEVGIAMGTGSDVALETADCALTHNRVTELSLMIALSRKTMGIVRQNIMLAIGSKAVFLITTLLGVTGLWAAVLADTGATALVTLNALRLLRFYQR
ncbi:zinc/cadmium/mercury/lead-transporting ATPase [Thaumasiovibrio sp. DFM-14]|uniref:zinc/cadmium/mercury/lead-transporting ATPase n=1 Tax=Thaumasiovibrio sp. DFM-14 TaxID=3384792 RepID=UPI0039A330E8